MTRKGFIDDATEKLGQLHYPRLGRLINRYTLKFLYECLDKFPVEKIEELNTGAKVGYLQRICQSNYTKQDLLHCNKLDTSL